MKKKPRVPTARPGGKPPRTGADAGKKGDRKARSSEGSSQGGWLSAGALREVVESVVVAFVLAFLFRTFEAEAFVIPTGSMAPTLMGRHKDLVCPKCRYPYQASASEEVNSQTNRPRDQEVFAATCPMCRFTADLFSREARENDTRSFKGDRILVAKFPYQFHAPDRWDVAVFMYPGGAKTNYIKRVAGLPDETIQISHGNVFVKGKNSKEFVMARKPPDKVLAMMQPVYDNDYADSPLAAAGWPTRWQAVPSPGGAAWQTSDLKSFSTNGAARGEAWLYYRHFVPTAAVWRDVLGGKQGFRPLPELITDFSSYNTGQLRDKQRFGAVAAGEGGLGPTPSTHRLGLHWVGDLVVEFELEADSAAGKLFVELVRGGKPFRAELDLATGQAGLSIDGLDSFRPTATTSVRGPGKHQLRFANVDDQLLLWVDGRLVRFNQPTTYDSRSLNVLRPREDDLAPARIGAQQAAARVSHLRLLRDVYYIARRYNRDHGGNEPMHDFDAPHGEGPLFSEDFFSNPRRWNLFDHLREVEFDLGPDQFFMLGDNSAASKDSRLWEEDCPDQFYVTRDLLKGKALFIYWPHSWDRTPGLPLVDKGLWFPMFPNLARMRFVR